MSHRGQANDPDQWEELTIFDEDGWARLLAEVPKMKVVTPSGLVERLKINASLARAACKYLVDEEKISTVMEHHKQKIYTRG